MLVHSAIGGIGSMAIYFITIVILARILSPYEFGVMAIISVIIGISGIFFENTLGSAIVHMRDVGQEFISSVFFSSLLLASILTLLMAFSSDYVESYFAVDGIDNVVRISSIVFVFNGLQVVPYALLQKEGDFALISTAELISILVGSIAAIMCAISGLGIWSLVFLIVITSFVKMILLFSVQDKVIYYKHDKLSYRVLWGYCSGLLGTNALNYLVSSVDQILVGKLFGASALGVYRLAVQMATLPQKVVTLTANRVYIHYYNKSQRGDYVRYAYLKLIKWTSFFIFPMLIGMAAISADIGRIVFGLKWDNLPAILSILAVSYMFTALAALNHPIYIYKGATVEQFKLSLVTRGIYLIFLGVGSAFGLTGMLVGILFSRVINFIIAFSFTGKFINVSLRDIFISTYTSLIAGMIMWLGIWGMQMVIPGDFTTWNALIVEILIGIILYLSGYLVIVGKCQREYLIQLFVRRLSQIKYNSL